MAKIVILPVITQLSLNKIQLFGEKFCFFEE